MYLEGGTKFRPYFVKVRHRKDEWRYGGTDQSCSFASPKGWVAMIGLRTIWEGENGRGMVRKKSL
jgi:hypothetical protein